MDSAARETAPIGLIVEDDADLREVAAAVLRQTDLQIVTCEDSEEAFATLCKRGNDVAFIFTDIHLPGVLDGVDLVRRVAVLWPLATVVVTSGDRGARSASLPDNIIFMPKPWVADDVLMQAWRATVRMQRDTDASLLAKGSDSTQDRASALRAETL